MKKILFAGFLAGSLLAACGGGSSTATVTSASVIARGTITGFGSVIVDGVHYDTSRADISIGGSSGHRQEDLSVGQRVTVTGSMDDHGNHVADHVDYEAELEGVVTAIDLAGNSFTALGQTVRVDESTVFSGIADLTALTVGDFVEVSGNHIADGSIVASFVKKEAPEADLELRGFIAALDTGAKTFSIGDQLVNYATATLLPSGFTPANGIFAEVEGNLSAGVLVATKVKQEDDFDDGEQGDEAEVEGIILDVATDRSSFHINTTLVRVDSRTEYVGGTSADLVAGVKVEAEGALAADGSLQAEKVKFRDEGHGAEGRIEAQISAVDPVGMTFTVLGITIQVTDTTVFRDSRDGNHTFTFSSLVVGDFVEVGFVESGSILTASRVERDQARSDSRLKAAVDSFDATAQTLVIAGVNIDAHNASYGDDDNPLTAEQFYGSLSVGAIVKVKGTFSGSLFAATEAELELDLED